MSACCPCRVVEFRGVDGIETRVETNASCECTTCHTPWGYDPIRAAQQFMHEARTRTNTHPKG